MSSNSQNTITETQSESRSPKAGRKSPKPGSRSPKPGRKSPKPGSRSPKPGKKTSKSRNTSQVTDSFILDKIEKYCTELDKDIGKNQNLIGRFIINLDDLWSNPTTPKTKKMSQRNPVITPKQKQPKSVVEETPPSVSAVKKSGSPSPSTKKKLKFTKGGGKKKGKGKSVDLSVLLNLPGTPEVGIPNHQNLGNGTSITNRSSSHSELFKHFFGDLLKGKSKMYELGERLQEQCKAQYPGSDLRVETILQGNLCVYEFYINKTSDRVQTPRFHFSLHGMGGRSGKLGLVHVVRDDLSRQHSNFMKWKNTVLLELKVKRTGVQVSLEVNSSHKPIGNRNNRGRNALVRRSHGERGAPTMVMQYGVTIARVFQEFIDSLPPMEVQKLNSKEPGGGK